MVGAGGGAAAAAGSLVRSAAIYRDVSIGDRGPGGRHGVVAVAHKARWRPHSCGPYRHFCRYLECREESRRGTQECVRHNLKIHLPVVLPI